MIAQERHNSLSVQIKEQVALNRRFGDRLSLRELGGKPSLQGFPWNTYGYDIASYEMSFRPVLEGKTISSFIEDSKSPVILDLMAPSATLASLLSKSPKNSQLGLAVSLEDERKPWEQVRDKALGIEQIAGDILQLSTWQRIKTILNGRKVDLIMERGLAGLNCIPMDPTLFAILMRRAWSVLSNNYGMLLIQTPYMSDMFDKKIIAEVLIERLSKKGLDISHSNTLLWNIRERAVIKLVKTPDSPEKLPI